MEFMERKEKAEKANQLYLDVEEENKEILMRKDVKI
jgi:hypothetical protein